MTTPRVSVLLPTRNPHPGRLARARPNLGAVVTRDLPSFALAVGIPGRVTGRRTER